MYRKQTWYRGEDIALEYYRHLGYQLVEKNFTIRGGEIDLILQDKKTLLFVEVKVVNYIENLHDYITAHKLQALQRSIETYLWKYPSEQQIRLDIVFVKGKQVVEVFENIEV